MTLYSSGHVDWLAVSMPATFAPHLITPPGLPQEPYLKSGPGYHGFRRMLTTESGLTFQYDGAEAQGCHIIYPGRTLDYLRSVGITDRALVEHLAGQGARVARLDLALNLHDTVLTVDDFQKAWSAGKLHTPAKQGLRMHDIGKPGDDLILGSRSSDRWARVYDKRAEQRVPGTSWLRLELQCRRLHARANFAALQAGTTRSVVNGSIGRYVRCSGELPDYEQALEELSEHAPIVPEREHDAERWLRKQVAPCLARLVLENPGRDMQRWFNDLVADEIALRLARTPLLSLA